MAKRVLVTGGAGSLGRHLCDARVDAGHDALCADNSSTGRRRNVVCLLEGSNFETIRHHVTSAFDVEVDEIRNLSGPASAIHYQFDPVQTTETSVPGAINMLGFATWMKYTGREPIPCNSRRQAMWRRMSILLPRTTSPYPGPRSSMETM